MINMTGLTPILLLIFLSRQGFGGVPNQVVQDRQERFFSVGFLMEFWGRLYGNADLRPLNNGEMDAFRAARKHAVTILKDNKRCRDFITNLLKNLSHTSNTSFLPDHVLNQRGGGSIAVMPTADFVFNSSTGASRYLDTYDAVTMNASGVSGKKGDVIEFGVTASGIVRGLGTYVPGPIRWNKEFFSQDLPERSLNVLHEIIHQFASDVSIANFLAGKEQARGQTCNIAILPCGVVVSAAWQEECGLRLRAGFII